MKSLFAFLIFTFLISFTSLGCDCATFKSFLHNIKKTDLVIYGEVVAFETGENGFLCEELMGIKVYNSFGANLESDTIWIRQSGGPDCSVLIDFFNERDKVYFALHSDSDCHNRFYISSCGEHYLKTQTDKNIAYGTVNFLDRRISKISKNYTGKISLKKLNRKLTRKRK